MQALWLEHRKLTLRDDVPQPDPPESEALVRVLQAGICNTDLELVRGYYPYTGVLGHEFVGEVQDGPPQLIGQRVVGEINAVCHQCRACLEGRTTHCERRTVLGIVDRNGAFAEYLSLPIENLHPVPDEVSTDTATFTEPLAAALEIQEQIAFSENDRVLVVGDGKLGQLIAQSLAHTGCDLLAIGRHPEKLDLLEQRGIRTGLADRVEPGRYDVAVECTGNPEGFALALSAVRPRGILVMKSTYAGDLTIDAAQVVVNELTLVGSRCGPFAPALRLLAERKVDVEPMVEARYLLSEGIAAMEHAERKGSMKVLLTMELAGA